MARAPSKATAAQARSKNAKADLGDTVVSLKWRGRDLTFSMGSLGPADDGICRAQTRQVFGMSFPFMGLVSQLQNEEQLGMDILATIVWMGRRKNGEPGLQLATAVEEVGDNEQLMKDLDMKPPAEPEVIDVGEAQPPGE